MLLQTIKSRNLWLWSEIVSFKAVQYTNREKLQKLNEEYHKSTNEMLQAPASVTQEQQENASLINAELRQEKERLETLVENDDFQSVSTYTAPFKITALQSVDVTWDNPVGESYGITANFLQSWHNKPVNITFKGISYMGAFGGNTVGNLVDSDGSEIKQASDVNGLVHIANNISAGFTSVAQSISSTLNGSNLSGIKSDASVDGKYDVVIDKDVEKINNLLSNYGEGLYPQKDKSGSPYIYLLMENPGSGTNNSEHGGFVTFIGHIKNFTYSERVDKPFLYDYTVQFVGEPTLQNSIRGATIEAQKDASSVKLTVVTSNSGYSLGYGW
jgi:hypothetical protein